MRKENKWGFFDIRGNQLVDFEYDSIGYIAKSSKDALNLLLIPDYNVIVVCKNEKYTLLNENGEKPFNAFVDDIYMIISAGQKHYYMTANDTTYDVEDYLDRIGVKTTNKENLNTSQNNNSNNDEQQKENSEQNGEQQEGQEQNTDQQENNEENVGEENQETNHSEEENQEQNLNENNSEENQE